MRKMLENEWASSGVGLSSTHLTYAFGFRPGIGPNPVLLYPLFSWQN